jgi:hypothetical protein
LGLFLVNSAKVFLTLCARRHAMNVLRSMAVSRHQYATGKRISISFNVCLRFQQTSATGIGGLGLLAWRRKRKAQAVA